MKKYLVVGGSVFSRRDGDMHYISADKLCNLYGVNPDECYLLSNSTKLQGFHIEDFRVLWPKEDGDYTL